MRKVKLLKAPKFDLGALLTLHGESVTDESGQKVSLMALYLWVIFIPLATDGSTNSSIIIQLLNSKSFYMVTNIARNLTFALG